MPFLYKNQGFPKGSLAGLAKQLNLHIRYQKQSSRTAKCEVQVDQLDSCWMSRYHGKNWHYMCLILLHLGQWCMEDCRLLLYTPNWYKDEIQTGNCFQAKHFFILNAFLSMNQRNLFHYNSAEVWLTRAGLSLYFTTGHSSTQQHSNPLISSPSRSTGAKKATKIKFCWCPQWQAVSE